MDIRDFYGSSAIARLPSTRGLRRHHMHPTGHQEQFLWLSPIPEAFTESDSQSRHVLGQHPIRYCRVETIE